MLAIQVFLFEAFKQNPLTKEDIFDESNLINLCKKYPKLFPRDRLAIENILPLLDKYIKAKTLPFSFFKPKILKTRESAMEIADRMTTYLVIGLIVGARLGYVFFYGWPTFKQNPMEIFKIWEGGLASHGASLGLLVGLCFLVYRSRKSEIKVTFFQILDILGIITGVIAFFIRLGNFVNQEIVGIPSNLPWAIIFKDPLGGEAVVPRHPVQLYEAFFYLFLALLTYSLWRKGRVKIGEGMMSGILIANLFTFRFFIEFLKEHQGLVVAPSNPLQMGQLLSIPFILFGLILILRPILKKRQYKRSLP